MDGLPSTSSSSSSTATGVHVSALPCTWNALVHLKNSLQCRKCHMFCQELFTLGQCEHRFCWTCVQGKQGATCPLCNMPSYATEICLDKQLSNIASLCLLMSDLFSVDQLPTVRETCQKTTVTQTTMVTRRRNTCITSPSDQRRVQSYSDHSSKHLTSFTDSQTMLTAESDKDNERKESFSLDTSNESNKYGIGNNVINTNKKAHSDFFHRDTFQFEATPTVKGHKKKSGPQDLKAKTLLTKSCHKTPSKSPSDNVKDKASNTIHRSTSKSKSYLSKRNAKGETPLHVATIKADVETVTNLLENGANPNVRDNAGWTPLHEAVNHGSALIAELLLNYGASVNAPGLGNDTPLHDAVINYRKDCVRLLVSRGANTLARNIHGQTPLDQAQTDDMREILLTACGPSLPVSDITTPGVMELSSQPLCYLGTVLSKHEQEMLLKCAKMFKAKVVDEFSMEVTHLITGVNSEGLCPRTLKYLNTVLAGQWVISSKWLASCLEHGSKAPETQYEVVGCTNNPHTMAPKKARENKCAQLPGLFDGCQFYFHGKFNYPTPSREELAGLVKTGGGAILTREPRLYNLDDYPYTIPFHALPSSGLADCAIFVIYEDSCQEPPCVEAQRMTCLPVSWLMDSVASFSLLDKTVYLKR